MRLTIRGSQQLFIKFFFGKDADLVTKQDLEVFTTRRIEENLNLDYKEIQAFDNPDELSKDISAFANSGGGLIILGVCEEKAGTGAAQRILIDLVGNIFYTEREGNKYSVRLVGNKDVYCKDKLLPVKTDKKLDEVIDITGAPIKFWNYIDTLKSNKKEK